jgi:hypothetical protein
MLGRRAAASVVLCSATVLLLCAGTAAGAATPNADSGRSSFGHSMRDQADGASGYTEHASTHAEHSSGQLDAAMSPDTTPVAQDVGSGFGTSGAESRPIEPVSEGPTVGGAPATTTGAAETEALVATTAPTPPNGAEPAAAWSPAVAVLFDAAVVQPAPPPVDNAPLADDALALPEPFGSALIRVTDPRPAAHGLSPDTMRSGALVAMLAFAVSLLVVAYQLVDRRNPRRRVTRAAEAVAHFR